MLPSSDLRFVAETQNHISKVNNNIIIIIFFMIYIIKQKRYSKGRF